MRSDRAVLGLLEEVTICGMDKKKTVLARIDTGATSSSIDGALAKELELKPGKGTKTIKSALGIRTRSIVHAKIKIDGIIMETKLNVADRSHMTYAVLVGRDILKQGHFLIDPSK